MTPELARYIDERTLFVLGTRLARALSGAAWDAAIRAIELMEPVVARVGGDRERQFQGYVVRLAQALPSEHPREAEFVGRARLLVSSRTSGQTDSDAVRRDDDRDDNGSEQMPIGIMTPLPLPDGGESVDADTARADIQTVLLTLPLFAASIHEVNRRNFVTAVPYFPGWHVVEILPLPREANDMPVASRAFFVHGETVAPIDGRYGVFQAIAKDSAIDLSTPEIASSYFQMYVACTKVHDTGLAGRIVEPGHRLPFIEGVDDSIKTLVRSKIEKYEVRATDDGQFAATGSMTLAGQLVHFDATIATTGNVEFHNLEPIPYQTMEDTDPKATPRILVDYVFTKSGWRILGDRTRPVAAPRDLVASGEVLPARLPTTLPTMDEGEGLKERPCVVATPDITTFAGLLLHQPGPDELDLLETIRAGFPAALLDGFNLPGARLSRLPFLPTHKLVLLPHSETGVLVPFVVGNGTAQLAGRANDWLYSLLEESHMEPREEVLVPYARFFFAVISSQTGRFTIVESAAEVPWSDAATEEDKKRAASIITPVTYLGRLGDGQFVLSLHVVFKHALFRTNYQISPNWIGRLTKEDLVLENQPFLQGADFDLTVMR